MGRGGGLEVFFYLKATSTILADKYLLRHRASRPKYLVETGLVTSSVTHFQSFTVILVSRKVLR